MAHRPFRTACAVTLSALALLAAASPAHADERPVVIRLYDIATGDADGRAAAMRIVAAMMADAGVTVDWRDCSRGGDAHPCRTVRGAHDLVVRIMPAYVPRAGETPREHDVDGDLQLGFAAGRSRRAAQRDGHPLLRPRAARRAPRRSRRQRSARPGHGARDRSPAAARARAQPLGPDARRCGPTRSWPRTAATTGPSPTPSGCGCSCRSRRDSRSSPRIDESLVRPGLEPERAVVDPFTIGAVAVLAQLVQLRR